MTSPARLSVHSATGIVIANMVGTGVFTTSGFALGDLGSRWLVLAAWLAGGVLATCGALCYGALALRMPESGGEYTYLRRTLHPTAGVAAGLVSLLVGFAAPLALAAQALVLYGARLFDVAPPEHPWIASAVLLAAALLHGHRVQPGARLQDAVVLGKLLLIVLFLLASLKLLVAGEPSPAPTSPTPWTGLARSMPWIALAYSGWNAAVYLAAEVEDAPRNVPRALLRGTLVVTVLYLLLNAAFLHSVPVEELVGRPEVAAIAARGLLGRGGEVLVTSIVVVALATSVLGMTQVGPRVTARMAADGALPAGLRGAPGTPPRAAMALQTVLALCFTWVTGLEGLMTYIGWTLSLCAAATVVGLVVLRRREGAARVPVVGYPLVPLVFLAGTGWFTVGSLLADPVGALAGLGALVIVALALLARARRPGLAA